MSVRNVGRAMAREMYLNFKFDSSFEMDHVSAEHLEQQNSLALDPDDGRVVWRIYGPSLLGQLILRQ